MLKAFFQISVTTIAYYICLTRIQDNWHRPIDVIVGSLLGVASAAMIVRLFSVVSIFLYLQNESVHSGSRVLHFEINLFIKRPTQVYR